jgi:hypothetical protein
MEPENAFSCVGYQVLKAVFMNTSAFWDDTVQSVESQPQCRRNMSSPDNLPYTGFSIELYFDLEDGGDMLLRNVA